MMLRAAVHQVISSRKTPPVLSPQIKQGPSAETAVFTIAWPGAPAAQDHEL